ncbi:unnamed protein product [Paramecium octaurelia]|uniref:Protein kinase domain-containing protein n=1 Tax=Paramecium octaurelia TaxID=43137 RepID=A0A8S1TCB5_PAROT|nr:unnamed protein product [Paramecium octaurelia]
MKGWLDMYKVTQKVKRNNNQVGQIFNFEKNNYLITKKIDDHLDYEFPQNECFSLAQLIEAMKCNCIKIYKGQVLIIILQVLKHLQQLHQMNLSHGRLKPQNIVIQLKNEKDHKLSIVQSQISIQQVYFINYRIIDEVEYEINCSQDVDDIIGCCIELIKAYSKTLCEQLQFIVDNLNQYKNDKKERDIQQLFFFLYLQIKDCVDLSNQKVKTVRISPSNFFGQVNNNIQCYEGEEYGLLSKRQRNQTIFITKFLKVIHFQLVDCELQLQNDPIENGIDQLVSHFDAHQLKQEEYQIFTIFESIIRQQMMKIIWKNYGEFLESNKQENNEEKLVQIIKIMNQTNKQILNNHLIIFLKEYKNIKQLNDEIQKDIDKYQKFDITYHEQKAKDQFILELKVQAQNYDFNNIQVFIDNIKTQVKQELHKFYYQILEHKRITHDFS